MIFIKLNKGLWVNMSNINSIEIISPNDDSYYEYVDPDSDDFGKYAIGINVGGNAIVLTGEEDEESAIKTVERIIGVGKEQ